MSSTTRPFYRMSIAILLAVVSIASWIKAEETANPLVGGGRGEALIREALKRQASRERIVEKKERLAPSPANSSSLSKPSSAPSEVASPWKSVKLKSAVATMIAGQAGLDSMWRQQNPGGEKRPESDLLLLEPVVAPRSDVVRGQEIHFYLIYQVWGETESPRQVSRQDTVWHDTKGKKSKVRDFLPDSKLPGIGMHEHTISFTIPATAVLGQYVLESKIELSTGGSITQSYFLNVVERADTPASPLEGARTAPAAPATAVPAAGDKG